MAGDAPLRTSRHLLVQGPRSYLWVRMRWRCPEGLKQVWVRQGDTQRVASLGSGVPPAQGDLRQRSATCGSVGEEGAFTPCPFSPPQRAPESPLNQPCWGLAGGQSISGSVGRSSEESKSAGLAGGMLHLGPRVRSLVAVLQAWHQAGLESSRARGGPAAYAAGNVHSVVSVQ